MSNTIIIKNSSVASKIPSPGDLTPGELAINTADSKLYTKNDLGVVVELATGEGGGPVGDFVQKIGDSMSGNLTFQDAGEGGPAYPSAVFNDTGGTTYGIIGSAGTALQIASGNNYDLALPLLQRQEQELEQTTDILNYSQKQARLMHPLILFLIILI